MAKGSEEVGYATGRATKADIVDAAFHVFAESGYGGTSVREIARRAGINHATLLHHFPKKSLLLQSVLEHRDELQHIEPTTLDDTLALLLGIAVRNEATPGLTRLFTLLAAESADPDHPARAYFRERLARLRHQIAHHIELAQATGQVPGAVDPQAAATDPTLTNHHRTHAVRAHFLEDVGDPAGARIEYELSARLTHSIPERRHLLARAARLA